MMNEDSSLPLRVAIVTGEESGDILGADLVRALRSISTRPVQLSGVGGVHLAQLGLKSLFDPQEIALMGFTAVIGKLPRLVSLIRMTTEAIVQEKPDIVIIIDSPDFTHRVAKKVKSRLPGVPIVNYVCPSVWAWRQGRAHRMSRYIDHVLAILPFEPGVLRELGGPEATYVGHRLAREPDILAAANLQKKFEANRFANGEKKLLLLPGSRHGEIRRTLPVIKEVVHELTRRVSGLQLFLPTLPHLETEIRSLLRDWSCPIEIATTHQDKMHLFGLADAALAASGTVTLETALCGIPTVAFYKMDAIAALLAPRLVKVWSASLPNLISDEALIPESYNEQATAGRLMRQIERLLMNGNERRAQLEGFDRLRQRMATAEAPGLASARIVLAIAEDRGH